MREIGNPEIGQIDSAKVKLRVSRGVTLLYFPALEETGLVTHAMSTRLGGVSANEFSTMNFAIDRGDDPANVRENYRRVTAAIGCREDQLVLSQQTHTTNLRVVTEADAGKGVIRPRDYHDIDGLLTDVPGLILVGSFADCVPLYFLDPVHRAVALSHSGWRGTVGRIGAKTVERMHEEYGTEPGDLIAVIGPSICRSCYEVSEEVAEAFRGIFPEEEWPEIMDDKGNGKYQLDLWECCRRTLIGAGMLPERVTVAGLCTCCHPNLLFSHRATKGKRGNLGAFLGLQ